MCSRIRQNFNEESEAAINKQINMELYASYVYLAMAYHFDRDDVSSKEFFDYYKKQSDEKREDAKKLIKYQNLRGGSFLLVDIKAPEKIEWKKDINTLEDSLALEKKVNTSLLALHGVAGKHNDCHLQDFIENEFLNEQVECINKLGKLLTQAKRCGDGLGEYQFKHLTIKNM